MLSRTTICKYINGILALDLISANVSCLFVSHLRFVFYSPPKVCQIENYLRHTEGGIIRLENFIFNLSSDILIANGKIPERARLFITNFNSEEPCAKSFSAMARIVHSFRPRTSVTNTRNLIFLDML